MKKDTDTSSIAAEIVRSDASDWLQDQYLPFTAYAIRSRALVSTDGLKPVNRRIVYAMHREGLTPNAKHMKASRVAGETAAFHPHGESSVQEALARMAQEFTLRIPLIDPWGQVGKNAGDTPAAARYWEARLTPASIELVRELSEGAVAMGKNFDGELDEPHLLPVRWPCHIINGTEGIAVGYASKMYPHNPDEIMNAAIAVLDNPDITVEKLLKIVPGPDFPTGGELFEIDGVKEYFETGSGKFVLRGKYTVDYKQRGKARITFTELPYQVSPESIKKRIRDIQNTGKLKEISAVKDLSDMKNGLKLVIDVKSGANVEALMIELFKLTPLENSYSVNNTVLIDDFPVRVSFKSLLEDFVAFRRQCCLNKARVRVGKIGDRLRQIDAVLSALVDIDRCISIIRDSETVEEAKKALCEAFSIESDQAEYILSMQLRRLTKSDSVALTKEKSELEEERARLEEVQNSKTALDAMVKEEMRATRKIISSPRRTVISGKTAEDVKNEAKASAQAARDSKKNLPCWITSFADGTVLKTLEPAFSVSHEAPVVRQLKTKTQSELVFVTANGEGHRLLCSTLVLDRITPEAELGFDSRVVAVAKTDPNKTEPGLVLATRRGEVKVVRPTFPNKREFTVMDLEPGDEIVKGEWCSKTLADKYFLSVTSDSYALLYPAKSVRSSGVGSGGVKSHSLREGGEVIEFALVDSDTDPTISVVSLSNKKIKLTPVSTIPSKGRGTGGVVLHKFLKGETHLVDAFVGRSHRIVVNELGTQVAAPPATARAASGTDFDFDVLLGSEVPDATDD